MTCKISYVQDAVFSEKAEEIHNQIKVDLLKNTNVKEVSVNGTSYFKFDLKFKEKDITEKYGRVLIYDNNIISINALISDQYLHFVADNQILRIKDYKELTPIELIAQDKSFSNNQLSDSLRKIQDKYTKDYGNVTGQLKFLDFLEQKDIVYTNVLNNGHYVGLYHQREETPKFSNLGENLDNSLLVLEDNIQNNNKSNSNNKFSGKLIYALPGTGKSFATKDNKNIVDTDEIEKEISGKSTVQEANNYYDTLSSAEKLVHEQKQDNLINKALLKGKIVVTSRRSLIDKTDFIITHNNVDRLINSVSKNDRENPYSYSKEKAQKLLNLSNKPNAIILKDGEFVLDIINQNNQQLYQTANSTLSNEKANKTLDNILIEYLKNFGVKVKDIEEFKNKSNLNILGVADLLNKVIFVAENRKEDTLPEETGHLITMLLGAKDPNIKELMSEITNWDKYQEIYDEYYPIYQSEERVKFEAVGKLLAQHLIKEFDNIQQENLFRKIINKILNKIKQYISFDTTNKAAQTIAAKIINNDLRLIDMSVPSNYVLLDIEKSFDSNFEAKRVNNLILQNKQTFLTGSLAISTQSKIYRDINEQIHDLDFFVTNKEERDKVIKNIIDNLGGVEAHSGIRYNEKYKDYECRAFIVPFDGYVIEEIHRLDSGTIIGDAIFLRRLSDDKIIYYGKDLITVIDLFVDEKSKSYNSYSDFYDTFTAKQSFSKSDVFFSRDKDQKDYNFLEANHITEPNEKYLYYQTTQKTPHKNLEEYISTLTYQQKILMNNLIELLGKVAPNFKIELVDKLLENGDNALTDFRDSVIQIGQNADFNDITEEIFHVLMESIDQKHLEDFEANIIHTQIYKEVEKFYPDYDKKRKTREALVKLVTQLSNDVPLEKFMTTKDKGVLSRLKKAIVKLLDVLFKTYSKIDGNDFFALTEAIMYSEVPYVNEDLSSRGQFASRPMGNKETIKMPISGVATLFTTLTKNGRDITLDKPLTIHVNALFTKVNNVFELTPLAVELQRIVELNEEMNTRNLLANLKIYIPQDITNTIDPELLEYIKDLQAEYPDEFTLTTDIINDSQLFVTIQKNGVEINTTTGLIKTELNIIEEEDSDELFEVYTYTKNGVPYENEKMQIYTGQLLNDKVVRYSDLTVPKTDYEESVEFFENIKDTELSGLISMLSVSLEKNLESLTKLGLVNTFTSNAHAVNVNLIKQMKQYKDADTTMYKANAVFSAMKDFEQLYRDLEEILKDNEDLDLKDYRHINLTIKTWNNIIKNIKNQLKEQRVNQNIKYDKYETYISQFKNSSDHLQDVVDRKIAEKVAKGIEINTNQFNASLDADIEELRQKMVLYPNMQDLIEKEIAEKVEKYNRLKIKDAEILNQLLQAERNDIDSFNDKLNLNPLFDRYLVNIRFGNDPILASFGANMEEIYHKSDVELQFLINTFNDLGADIESLNGGKGTERYVGNELTKLVQTFEYKKVNVTEIHNEVSIKLQLVQKISVIKKQIINQWGNSDDYLVIGYEVKNEAGQFVTGTLGDLNMDIENYKEYIDKNILNFDVKEEENTVFINIVETRDKLVKIKREFTQRNFHQYYEPKIYQSKQQAILIAYASTINKNGDNRDLKYVAELYESANKERNRLFGERQAKEQSLLNITEGNKDQKINLKGEIGILTAEIVKLYSHTEGDKGLQSTMLSKVRELDDSYKTEIANEEVFIRDLQILIQELDPKISNSLSVKLTNSYKDGDSKRPLEDILTDLIEIHLGLNAQRELTPDDRLVKRFLDESLWYKPTEEFYESRKLLYDKITMTSLLLNPQKFGATLFTSKVEAENFVVNEMKSLNSTTHKTAQGNVSNMSSITKMLSKKTEDNPINSGYITFEYLNNYAVVYLEDGSPTNKNQNIADKKTYISDMWESILEITKKYRDKFGYIYSMSAQHQSTITEFEQVIYDEMAEMKRILKETKDNNRLSKEIKAIRESIVRDIENYSQQVEAMQDSIITENYFDTMRTLFEDYKETTIPEFRKVATANYGFENNLSDLLSKMDKSLVTGFLSIIRSNPDNDLDGEMTYSQFLKHDWIAAGGVSVQNLFGKEDLNFKNFTEQDFQILKGIIKNHVVKSHLEKDGRMPVIPTYNFRKITPKDVKKSLKKFLDNKYKSKQIKEEHTTHYILNKNRAEDDQDYSYRDFKGDFQLLEDPTLTGLLKEDPQGSLSNYQLVKAYKDLQTGINPDDDKLRKIYKNWVEAEIIDKQRSIALGESWKINKKGSLIGYTIPYLEKQYSEMGWWEGLREFGRDIWGSRNKNEQGDFSIPEPGSVEETELENKKWNLAKIIDVIHKFINRSGSANYFGGKNQQFIPVDYTTYADGNKITNNIFLAHAVYMASLLKAKHINKDIYKINALRDTLRKNDPYSRPGKANTQIYKRLEILEENINSEIYRNNIGDNNPLTRILRVVKRMMVYKSQSVANVVGFTKNLEAGLLQNYINSLTTSDSFVFDKKSRVASDISSTVNAFKLAYQSFGNNNLKDESLVQYLSRQLNPQARNIRDMFKNKDRYDIKNLIFEEKAMFAGLKVGETVISYQLMLDVVKRLKLKQGENEISFLDAFEKIDGSWEIKKGVTTFKKDADGNFKQFDDNDFLEVKKMIDMTRFKTMGHSKFKGVIFNNSYVRSLFFFISYLIPLMRDVLVLQRRDFYTNQIVDNFNLSFLKYIAKSLQYGVQGTWYWKYMSTHDRQNVTKAIVTYSSLYTLVMLMKYLFNFDPDEKDAYKKLNANNQLQNFLLVTTLKTASEIEQLSIFNLLSDTMFPVITANYNAIKNPTLLRLITDIGKTAQLTLNTGLYEVGMKDGKSVIYQASKKDYGIEKGDLKLGHALNKFNPFNSRKNYDFITQIKTIQQLSNN